MTLESPKIVIEEVDNSTYTIVSSEYGIAIVGFATKGPIDTPVEISSEKEFIKTFGGCSAGDNYTYMAVMNYLKQTDRVIFVRVADTDVDAPSTITVNNQNVTPATIVTITSVETGTANNDISVLFGETINPIDSTETPTMGVYYKGELVESFSGFSYNSLDLTDSIEVVVNKAPENGGSSYINLVLEDDMKDEKPVVTSTTLAGGNDGIPSSNPENVFYVETTKENVLGLNGVLSDKDNLDFHFLAIPFCAGELVVQKAAIALAEDREDCLFLLDPAVGETFTSVVAWSNGKWEGGTAADAFDSSYAAIYYAWQKDKNPETKQYVLAPPSVFVGERLLNTCTNEKPWLATAGKKRGKLSTAGAETYPTEKQRDELYGGINCVNPISFFKGDGACIWGQKTTQRALTTLNRVNVRIMLIVIKKRLKKVLDALMFDPNSPVSWGKAKTACEKVLQPFAEGDNPGLSGFSVKIDASLNEGAVNEMNGVIQIVPYGTIENINIKVGIQPVGTVISEV